MEDRIVAFVKALRAAGVRVSLAESLDSFKAIEHLGITDRQLFHDALLATMVKDGSGVPAFEELFPLFFGTGDKPMMTAGAGLSDLTPEEMDQLRREIAQLRDRVRELMQRLMDGRNLTPEELQELARPSGINHMQSLNQRRWVERRMEQQLGLSELKEALEQLLAQLEQGGMSAEALSRLFVPFVQVADSGHQRGGTGLGLVIAQKLAGFYLSAQ